jgi:ABC-type phosphate/phosphonate transport system substrate-binding protein
MKIHLDRMRAGSRTRDLLAAVNRGELSIVNLPAIEYLDIRKNARMSPSLLAAGYHENKYRYLIVARRDSGITSIPKLRGKSLAMATQKIRTVGSMWLSVLLSRNGYVDPSKFLGEIKESISPSKALLNVYFGKYDAAMLSRGALEASIALNPQLGRQLAILAESGNFPGSITCIPHNVSTHVKRRIEERAVHLHESSVGKQMFTLFQMERAVPFNPVYLEGLEELVRDWKKLSAQRGRR